MKPVAWAVRIERDINGARAEPVYIGTFYGKKDADGYAQAVADQQLGRAQVVEIYSDIVTRRIITLPPAQEPESELDKLPPAKDERPVGALAPATAEKVSQDL